MSTSRIEIFSRRRPWLILRLWAGVVAGALLPASSFAEIHIAAFLGVAKPYPSEVRLAEAGSTNLRLSPIAWDDASLRLPLYYSLRAGWWGERLRQWGVALDFTHAKLYARIRDSVRVQGERNGTAIDTREPVSMTFSRLSFSHGCNLFAVNALRRWTGEFALPVRMRFGVHYGLGAGIAIPHAEIRAAAIDVNAYRISGPLLQGQAGLHFFLAPWLAIAAEYKFSWCHLGVNAGSGASLSADALMHHFTAGLTGIIAWHQRDSRL